MRPIVISIAGLDPSGGAGILADIKTFEQIGVLGFGVCSALTYQREDRFEDVEWLSFKKIKKQLDLLVEVHSVDFCKIGMIKNKKTLDKLLSYLQEKNIKVILDPILAASAGFVFHEKAHAISDLLDKIYLITPNYDEFKNIAQKKKIKKAAIKLSESCHILIKGGHRKKKKGIDILFTPNQVATLYPRKGKYYSKHGSGCILSSAITSYLALGQDIYSACLNGKEYCSNTLQSNSSLLAYHNLNILNAENEKPEKKSTPPFPLQYISQGNTPKEHLKNIKSVLKAGGKWIQLRIKNTPIPLVEEVAKKAKKYCDAYDAVFILNDHPAIAKKINATGVHLGKKDMSPLEARKILGEDKIIGGTANTFDDIQHLSQQNVNYIGLGPYTFTTTKKNLEPTLGKEGYLDIIQKINQKNINIPIYAIGGIQEKDIPVLKKTGVSGIAISGCLTHSDDKKSIIDKTLKQFNF